MACGDGMVLAYNIHGLAAVCAATGLGASWRIPTSEAAHARHHPSGASLKPWSHWGRSFVDLNFGHGTVTVAREGRGNTKHQSRRPGDGDVTVLRMIARWC